MCGAKGLWEVNHPPHHSFTRTRAFITFSNRKERMIGGRDYDSHETVKGFDFDGFESRCRWHVGPCRMSTLVATPSREARDVGWSPRALCGGEERRGGGGGGCGGDAMWNAADEEIQMPWLRFLGPSSLGVFAAGCQIQACVILLGFVAAWHWAARRRFIGRRELERRGTTRTVWCKPEETPDEAPEAASKRSAGGSVSHQGGGRGANRRAGGAGGRKDVRSSDTGPVPRSLTSVLPQEGASGCGVPAPKVSVILPVKGIHSESLAGAYTRPLFSST